MRFDESLFDCEFVIDADFGIYFTNRESYKPDADWMLVPFTRLISFGPTSIVHFFLWDTYFARIDPAEKFVQFLEQAKACGVHYVCQTDFSCWYHYDEQRRVNLTKNFEYLQMIQDAGLKAILNFNTIWIDHFDFYREILPEKIDAVIFDFNHNEKGYAHIEIATLERFLASYDLKLFFVITGKMYMPVEYRRFFSLLKEAGVRVIFLPTEYRKMTAKKRKFYHNPEWMAKTGRKVAKPPE